MKISHLIGFLGKHNFYYRDAKIDALESELYGHRNDLLMYGRPMFTMAESNRGRYLKVQASVGNDYAVPVAEVLPVLGAMQAANGDVEVKIVARTDRGLVRLAETKLDLHGSELLSLRPGDEDLYFTTDGTTTTEV